MKSILQYVKGHTYIKYFFSYLLIIVVLFVGFFFIINRQLTNRFFVQRSMQLQTRLDNAAEWLNNSFDHLIVMDESLRENLIPLSSYHKDRKIFNYHTHLELNKYDSSALMVSSIVYKPANSTDILATNYLINYKEDKFTIQNYDLSSPPIIAEFDPAPYLNSDYGQFLLLSNEPARYLIYFPVTKSLDKGTRFYILNMNEITQYLKSILSGEILAVALIDANGQFASDVNGALLAPYKDYFSLTDGVHSLDSSNSICIQTGIYSGFSLVALISQDSLARQVNAAFYSSYLTLLILSVIAFMLIYYAMHITYTPLKQLSAKLLTDDVPNEDHIKQLESVFDKSQTQNLILTQKLDRYRLFMQKSLLDSLITQDSTYQTTSSPNIDQFFDTECKNEIFIIHMMSTDDELPCHHIQTSLQKILHSNDSCILLESRSTSATFLINYTGSEPNKPEVLKELLHNYYEEEGYLSAISCGSASPLDIPSLYEDALQASSYWPAIPVAENRLSTATATYSYPHQLIQQLSILLSEQKFSEAGKLIDDIFRIIDNSSQEVSKIPEFFIRCILIDVLTCIANSMSKAEIKYDSYEQIYTETLFLCRSCPYAEKAEEIKCNTIRFINLYEQEFSNIALTPSQVIQLMNESFADPDFSIALLAEKCHVSIAYMSYLIKKELNQSFSDYRWTLRLNKAKELLGETDMPIDEVSIALGYLSSSSFQRKFKNETGMTPSQFRSITKQAKSVPSKK